MSAISKHKLQRAQQRLQNGDVHGARQLCEEILARSPRDAGALCIAGITHLVAGDPQAALPLLEQALVVSPADGLTLEHAGVANLMLGRFAAAERVLRRAAAVRGAPPSVFMRL